MNYEPGYIKLLESGELKQRAETAEKLLNDCRCCPRDCGADRKKSEYGKCLSGYLPVISSYTPHFGEEPVLTGNKGAGNIFFGNCNMRCIFCQNYEISQNWKDEKKNEVSFGRLAEIMLELQDRGCHNIGLVSPTHFAPQIICAISIAAENGLRLPIIYNTNGYDSVDILRLFDGIIDIYLPDFKYGESGAGKKYSKIDGYFEKAGLAVKEMHRQVGSSLVFDNNVVVKGLIIRHLVLPNGLSDSEEVFRFIAGELDPGIAISLMSQYFPSNHANQEILLDRRLRPSEYEKAIGLLEKYGLKNGWIQEIESADYYRPFFDKDRENPFGN